MKLQEYLDKNNMTAEDLAKEIKASPLRIYPILCGKAPRLDTAIKINIATKGEVTFIDMQGTDGK